MQVSSVNPSLTPVELAAWRGLLRSHAALVRDLDAELHARHDLSLHEYEVLLTLADAPDGRMRMSELATAVVLSQSGLTRLVDRLVRDGSVARVRCEGDRRGLERRAHGVRQTPLSRGARHASRRCSQQVPRPVQTTPSWGPRRVLGTGLPRRYRRVMIGSSREDRHRSAVLVVVLGCGRRARRAPGAGARGAWPRGTARDGERPAGSVHARRCTRGSVGTATHRRT